MRNYLIIFLILSLGSCRYITDASRPRGSFLQMSERSIPNGSPLFKLGWRDGCRSGWSGRGNSLYRTIYNYSEDPALAIDPEYIFGRKKGYGYCWYYINSHLQGSWEDYIFYNPRTFTLGNYNDVMSFGSISFIIGAGEKAPFIGGGVNVLGVNPLWSSGSSGWLFGNQ